MELLLFIFLMLFWGRFNERLRMNERENAFCTFSILSISVFFSIFHGSGNSHNKTKTKFESIIRFTLLIAFIHSPCAFNFHLNIVNWLNSQWNSSYLFYFNIHLTRSKMNKKIREEEKKGLIYLFLDVNVRWRGARDGRIY